MNWLKVLPLPVLNDWPCVGDVPWSVCVCLVVWVAGRRPSKCEPGLPGFSVWLGGARPEGLLSGYQWGPHWWGDSTLVLSPGKPHHCASWPLASSEAAIQHTVHGSQQLCKHCGAVGGSVSGPMLRLWLGCARQVQCWLGHILPALAATSSGTAV